MGSWLFSSSSCKCSSCEFGTHPGAQVWGMCDAWRHERVSKRREIRPGFIASHTPPTDLNAFRNAVKTEGESRHHIHPHTPERISKRRENRAGSSGPRGRVGLTGGIAGSRARAEGARPEPANERADRPGQSRAHGHAGPGEEGKEVGDHLQTWAGADVSQGRRRRCQQQGHREDGEDDSAALTGVHGNLHGQRGVRTDGSAGPRARGPGRHRTRRPPWQR